MELAGSAFGVGSGETRLVVAKNLQPGMYAGRVVVTEFGHDAKVGTQESGPRL